MPARSVAGVFLAGAALPSTVIANGKGQSVKPWSAMLSTAVVAMLSLGLGKPVHAATAISPALIDGIRGHSDITKVYYNRHYRYDRRYSRRSHRRAYRRYYY